jgi:hypothetical protein
VGANRPQAGRTVLPGTDVGYRMNQRDRVASKGAYECTGHLDAGTPGGARPHDHDGVRRRPCDLRGRWCRQRRRQSRGNGAWLGVPPHGGRTWHGRRHVSALIGRARRGAGISGRGARRCGDRGRGGCRRRRGCCGHGCRGGRRGRGARRDGRGICRRRFARGRSGRGRCGWCSRCGCRRGRCPGRGRRPRRCCRGLLARRCRRGRFCFCRGDEWRRRRCRQGRLRYRATPDQQACA